MVVNQWLASMRVHYAARLKARQAGAARAWAGSPPMSSSCNSHACSTLAGCPAAGQKANLPADSRLQHSQNPCPS